MIFECYLLEIYKNVYIDVIALIFQAMDIYNDVGIKI